MIPLFKVLMDPGVPDAVARTIASGTVTEGPRVAELEGRLERLLGLPILTLNSGTSALHLAVTLLNLDVRRGDGVVISTPITCAATNAAIVRAGGRIAWADVDPVTGLLDPASVNEVANRVALAGHSRNPVAVMTVDWGGQVSDIAALRAAVSPDVAIIEDAAHAFGALRAMPTADAVCFSFQAIKHLTTGDGGGLYVADPAVRDRARRLRWFGIDRRAPGPNIDKPIDEAGFKYHMNDLNAAIGLANLDGALDAVGRHRANAAWYGEAMKGISGVRTPPSSPGSAWWLYTLILEPDGAQAGFQAFMRERGVECSKVHSRNDTHRAFGPPHPYDLPGVTYFDSHQIAIPVGWWVTNEDRDRIAQAVYDWSKQA